MHTVSISCHDDSVGDLRGKFGDHEGQLPEQLPAFPQESGESVSKDWVVKCIEALAVMLGLDVTAPDGKRALGGHTLRVSGARHLSYRGLDTRIIMLIARWEREVILRYVKDAPLTRLADLCRAGASSSSTDAPHNPVGVMAFSPAQLQVAEEHARDARDAVDRLAARFEALEAREARCNTVALPAFVISRSGNGCIHKVVTDYLVEPPSRWRTCCGWAYGDASFARRDHVADLAAERRCEKCISQLGYETT